MKFFFVKTNNWIKNVDVWIVVLNIWPHVGRKTSISSIRPSDLLLNSSENLEQSCKKMPFIAWSVAYLYFCKCSQPNQINAQLWHQGEKRNVVISHTSRLICLILTGQTTVQTEPSSEGIFSMPSIQVLKAQTTVYFGLKLPLKLPVNRMFIWLYWIDLSCRVP